MQTPFARLSCPRQQNVIGPSKNRKHEDGRNVMPDTPTDHLRRPITSRHFRFALASTLVAILAPVAPTPAADCVQPNGNVAAGATFRATPAASGTALGRL